MTIRKYAIAGLTLVSAIAATILIVSLASATATPIHSSLASSFGTTITGNVKLPEGGLPVPDGTWVWLLKPDVHILDPYHDFDPAVHGQSIVSQTTGEFSFANVGPGNYILRAVPPEDSGYTPSLIQPVIVLNTPVSVGTLNVTTPTITGTIYLPGGAISTTATVHVYAGPVEVEVRRTLMSGTFALGGLNPGTYSLGAEPLPDAWLWWSQKITNTIVSNETHYVSLTLRTPDVYGAVKDSVGAPVAGATVFATRLADGEWRADVTGWRSGHFAIGDLPGLAAEIRVEPPPERAGLMPTHTIVSLVSPTLITLTLESSPKVVTGVVWTNNVIMPVVRNALVVANRVGALGWGSTESDASGQYTLTLAPGLWALTVKPISTSVPSHWVYPRPPQLVQFDDTSRQETTQLDFKVLMPDATVVGLVELPDHSTPPFTVTVGLHTDEGLGIAQDVPASGQFTFQVPHGKYNVDVRVLSPPTGTLYAAPPVDPIYAAPLATTLIPTITLAARDAAITGTLTVSGTNTPVADIPVIAWNPATHAAFPAHSGPDGVYIIAVYTGTWLVRPAPLPDQPYLYTGEPKEVVLATAGQIVGSVNFGLLNADSTIHGVLVDSDGDPAVDAHGWGKVVNVSDSTIRNGAPVLAGVFDILVPGGATYSVTLRLADGSRYVYTGAEQVASVGISATQYLTFTLTEKNARFWGTLNDPHDPAIPPKLPGQVWAWGEGMGLSTDIHDGAYSLSVPAGLWGLDYSVPEDSDYVKLVGARYYGVGPGPTRVDLPVAKKDGVLTGTVLLPGGGPAVGAFAVVEGFSPNILGLTMRAPVGAEGTFSMSLPSGMYIVRATGYSDESLINPVAKHVRVPPNGSVSVTLQYRDHDAEITGRVTLSGTTAYTGTVALFAWTSNGGYNKTTAEVGGVYTMLVTSNTLWRLAAVYETRDQYWKARAQVPVTITTPVIRDLVLDGPFTKPAPVSVMFDPTQEQSIELPDGTRIYIPAGAMPVESGNVLLHITPLAGSPHHHNGDVLGLTYAVEAFDEDGRQITEHFNQDVLIVLHYNPLELRRLGLTEDHLKPAYFSTSTNSWTFPDSYIVDTVHNEISMLIDHFTRYGALGVEGPYTVYLPIVSK
jgi:hypothetical protein